jgi:hypothetical protein
VGAEEDFVRRAAQRTLKRAAADEDGRRGPRSEEWKANMRRGVYYHAWVRKQATLAVEGKPHVAIPTEEWLRGGLTENHRKRGWTERECIPCWQAQQYRGRPLASEHLPRPLDDRVSTR